MRKSRRLATCTRKKQQDKAKAKAFRNAKKAIAKLSPVALALKTSLASVHLKHVPEFVVKKAKTSYNSVSEIMNSATKVAEEDVGVQI